MERQKGWLTSGAFAALCGTTKETLRHYKDIGLLSPAYQGDNGYFYYDVEQFYDFYAVSIFRQTGTPLEEIRRCLQGQDTVQTLALLREQRGRLEAERQKLEHMDFVLSSALHNLEFGPVSDMVPQTAWFEKEHLLALPAEELEGLMAPAASENEMLIAVLERCQRLCGQYGIQTDFQLGAVHRPGERGGPGAISHLYTRIKEKADFPYYMEKPAGHYLYLCCRGRWDISEGYAVLKSYILEQGLQIMGNFYACDLAGFILNSVEKNAASMISVRLLNKSLTQQNNKNHGKRPMEAADGMEKKVTEVVAALIWDGDRFLICQRPAHKARGLLWEFVGGKVEPGETKEQALVRECREELAVTISAGEVFMEVDHSYPDLHVHLTLFNGVIIDGTPQMLEHNDIRWITTEEIPQYEFCPADETILRRLRQ